MRVFEQYFSIRIVTLCSNCEQTSIFCHILLIADPYSDHKFGWTMQHNKVKRCLKCEKIIRDVELHKIVMYVVEGQFTEHHYEHVECPDRFTI